MQIHSCSTSACMSTHRITSWHLRPRRKYHAGLHAAGYLIRCSFATVYADRTNVNWQRSLHLPGGCALSSGQPRSPSLAHEKPWMNERSHLWADLCGLHKTNLALHGLLADSKIRPFLSNDDWYFLHFKGFSSYWKSNRPNIDPCRILNRRLTERIMHDGKVQRLNPIKKKKTNMR